METLKIASTKDTPSITFDVQTNEYLIEGNSLPENASIFYKPVYDWINNYVIHNNLGFELRINLNYLNSSSVKFIFALLMKMNEGHMKVQSDSSYKVVWKHKLSDELMKQKGDEFKSFLELPFEVVSC